ncbi:MAG TPA: zinc-ribbon domain-containing protein [Candidatus Omnitrophota bacterium]|nr:zinc-ribbon domain-containing protein [Candidatus Omnitrophota bacterium]
MTEHICPNCGKPIYDDEALLCLYCGENLERPVGVLGKLKYNRHHLLAAALIAAVIAAFFVFMTK